MWIIEFPRKMEKKLKKRSKIKKKNKNAKREDLYVKKGINIAIAFTEFSHEGERVSLRATI